MEWKMFGMKRKLISVRRRAFKVLRLMNGLGKEDPKASRPASALTVAPYEPVNPLTNYSLEAELNKAQALAYWRIWQNRPK